jgi:hypothetical protein
VLPERRSSLFMRERESGRPLAELFARFGKVSTWAVLQAQTRAIKVHMARGFMRVP